MIFEDRTYMADGPKNFSELSPELRQINSIAIASYERQAGMICDALNAYRQILQLFGANWQDELAKLKDVSEAM